MSEKEIYDKFCLKARKKISRRPLRECDECKHLLMTNCPKFELKEHKNIPEDMRKWFSKSKGGESTG